MHVSFVHPEFLWGWAFVLVPILLHLFDWKRYKTVYFPHVAALQQAQQRHKRQRQLRRRLVLACRVAAIVCVV
ncbi:MAG: BatA domain-containing protein, partial [Bacteroidales bacterium]|nr:BatA domain-containing protein [Bacteroidales bacterium]